MGALRALSGGRGAGGASPEKSGYRPSGGSRGGGDSRRSDHSSDEALQDSVKNERLYRLRKRLHTARPSRRAGERARETLSSGRVGRRSCPEASRLSIASGGTCAASVALFGRRRGHRKRACGRRQDATRRQKVSESSYEHLVAGVRRRRCQGSLLGRARSRKKRFSREGGGGGGGVGGVDVFVPGPSGLDNSAE